MVVHWTWPTPLVYSRPVSVIQLLKTPKSSNHHEPLATRMTNHHQPLLAINHEPLTIFKPSARHQSSRWHVTWLPELQTFYSQSRSCPAQGYESWAGAPRHRIPKWLKGKPRAAKAVVSYLGWMNVNHSSWTDVPVTSYLWPCWRSAPYSFKKHIGFFGHSETLWHQLQGHPYSDRYIIRYYHKQVCTSFRWS